MGRPSRSVALFRYECAPDMKDIFALKLYTRVARLGSFSAAARECNLSQSQASRIVAELEESLGTRSCRAPVCTENLSPNVVMMDSAKDDA